MKTSHRQEGLMVFETESAADKLIAFSWIADNKTFAIMDGIAVDGFSASGVTAICDLISDTSKQKLLNWSIPKIIAAVYTLLAKYGTGGNKI